MSHPAVRIMVQMTLDTLSDDELAAVNLALALGGGVKPYHLGYEKVKPLLNNDGTAHEDVISLISEEAFKRLS